MKYRKMNNNIASVYQIQIRISFVRLYKGVRNPDARLGCSSIIGSVVCVIVCESRTR